jgi:hypothetical protein
LSDQAKFPFQSDNPGAYASETPAPRDPRGRSPRPPRENPSANLTTRATLITFRADATPKELRAMILELIGRIHELEDAATGLG